MMSTRRGLATLVAVGVFVALLATGCGPKPPCPVAPSVVKEAQAKTATVETSLSQAETEKASLEKQLADKQAKLASLKGKPGELEKKLDNLKKGSGR
jgi:septal ring factor EnvC (AmiA/AmiB activator)